MAAPNTVKRRNATPSRKRAGDETKRRERTADGEKVHQMLVRIPESLHEKLRHRAFEEDRPKAEIIRDSLTLYLR